MLCRKSVAGQHAAQHTHRQREAKKDERASQERATPLDIPCKNQPPSGNTREKTNKTTNRSTETDQAKKKNRAKRTPPARTLVTNRTHTQRRKNHHQTARARTATNEARKPGERGGNHSETSPQTTTTKTTRTGHQPKSAQHQTRTSLFDEGRTFVHTKTSINRRSLSFSVWPSTFRLAKALSHSPQTGLSSRS